MKEAFWIVDQLVQQGVRHFCIAPGSRSAPLALAAADHPKATIHVHFDERGLGFLALGLKNAALIVTSGTAVGNLLPSIMEAHHTCTPLIVLTADRPHELRDSGANQTTDQVKIFQSFVRWQTDLTTPLDETYFRSITAQAYFHSRQNPPGPVHINCPLREPLYTPHTHTQGKPIPLTFPRLHATTQVSAARGLIVIGQLPEPDDIYSILQLAKRIHWPVYADILSNARCTPTPEQIRNVNFRPDTILHFGDRLTRKEPFQADHTIHISPFPNLEGRHVTARVQSHIPEFCATFNAPPHLFSKTETFTIPDCLEAKAMLELASLLPFDFGAFFGSGMPIRNADNYFFPKQCRGFFGNRGLSGIDGNIATLAGLAHHMPMIGFIGDQACLHDLNSLPLLKKTPYPAILIVSNNRGGRIFSTLPVVQSPHFDTLFLNSHTYTFEQAAQMFDLPYSTDLQFQQSALIELCTVPSFSSTVS